MGAGCPKKPEPAGGCRAGQGALNYGKVTQKARHCRHIRPKDFPPLCRRRPYARAPAGVGSLPDFCVSSL